MAAAAASKRRKSSRGVERYVPPELVREILVRLPCKSLDRFKSVNKQLASFVHDVQFIDEHRKRNMKPSHYLKWDKNDKTKLHVFSLRRDEYRHVKAIATEGFRVALSSSYGLVCLHGWESKSIALLNPVSGQMVYLPHLPRPFAFQTKNEPGAAEPTTWRANNIGFGFDLKSQKYKIIQFVFNLDNYAISHCYVLTVNDGPASSWREIDVPNKSKVNIYFQWLPIYVDGVLYWEIIAHDRHDTPIEVFVFDLSTEKMSVLESPTKFRFDKYGGGKHLTTLEGKLCCIDITPPVDTLFVMKIWKLSCDFDRNDVSWILSYKLDIYGYSSLLYPLYMDGEKSIICESFRDLYRYDIQSKSLEIYPVREKVEGVVYSACTNFSTVHSETIIPIPSPLSSS